MQIQQLLIGKLFKCYNSEVPSVFLLLLASLPAPTMSNSEMSNN